MCTIAHVCVILYGRSGKFQGSPVSVVDVRMVGKRKQNKVDVDNVLGQLIQDDVRVRVCCERKVNAIHRSMSLKIRSSLPETSFDLSSSSDKNV